MENAQFQLQWQEWFEQHGPRLAMFARQQTRTEADAEDVLQEAMVKIWRTRRETDETPDPPQAYAAIRRCAIDQARRNQRRTRREEKAEEWYADRQTWFETSLEHDERASIVQNALKSLPSEQRDVLTLKIWGELTFAQIGESLAISANTAASRYRYGLNALRRLLRSTEVA